MLKVFKNKINTTNRTNSSNIVRLVESFNEEATLPLLTSDLLGEGIFSFEVVANDTFIENYVVTPPFFRNILGEECFRDYQYLKNSLNTLHCYTIELTSPSFLPIFTENEASLLQDLSLLQQKSSELFIQLLITLRQDNWREIFIDQYEEYLRGNDFPSAKRVQRRMQRSILNVLNKVSGTNTNRKEVKEISNKILDNGYRFELRIINTDDDFGRFENELSDLLKEYDFFNCLRFFKDRNKKQFIDNFLNRRFSPISKDQLISETELLSILSSEQVVIKQETIIERMEDTKKTVTKINNFDLLPIGVKKDREVDHGIIAQLPGALKKARATKTDKIEILDVELGATVQRITFKIPKDHVYTDIKNRHNDINSALGSDINIIQGKEANTVTFLIPCQQRDIIYLKELLESKEFQEFTQDNPLPFVCGLDMYNQPVFKCLTKAPHLLIVGGTNSGKSVFMNSVLMTLMLLKSPNELRLFLIDPKKVELTLYEGLPHVEGKVIKDMEEAIGKLDGLINEMENRYDKMSKKGVKNIAAYNRQSKSKMPYIICVIDEYNDLRMQYADVESKIERLGQKARASGIHLIIATQTPNKDVMSNTLKTNLPSRISFKLDNSNEYKTVFGTGIPYRNLLGFGDGVVKYVAQTEEFIRFQAPVITLDENEEEKTFNNLKKLYKGEQIEELDLPEIEKESDLDRLKRIIAESGETRVGELRKEMGIKMNIVSDLMQQLVLEGWLEKPETKNKGYQLIAGEEELDKWRS
ncbi:FtsK/SpoIIIE domain-containing protein [uncultured Metabacillus sp.]|uniref:FtsK/SpoIIIE domain-containing protein n=1 Tax=uncultured Metabacillus sp. TaxID=2860135 RepID=UPI002635CA59|nr:FtsK/SpoIIIE domain-containing protein [uncultured Metabacillus sp.]